MGIVGEIIAAISRFELGKFDDNDSVDACDIGASDVSLISAKSFPGRIGKNTSIPLTSFDVLDFACLLSGVGDATGENGT